MTGSSNHDEDTRTSDASAADVQGRSPDQTGQGNEAPMVAGRSGHLEASPSTPEEDAWLDDLVDRLAQPTRAERLFYKRRQALGLGCGLDAAGNLVYAKQFPGADQT